ncbi:hypothetical protein PNEG_02569 [Pneumocystis murina B123]|uniref:Class E vacuolar protein-sorting machinery protein HSE1 n=1 Tax=Pneumocystis murina (strain B123) TaxID=1069680 RepID=M7PFK1_PNEMU|nr:hypothetical protein PNEG_02569 [Pneumocystis murina B123]EMR09234.1 hypothetical protein PNEG_02569 [Pneumocystis murina B123]
MNQKLETIEALICRATDEYLTQENWEYILDVCDCLNQGGDIKMAVFVLQRRFLCGNESIQLYCLSLVEALVKNCGLSVQREVSSEVFIEIFLKYLEDVNAHFVVKERILLLIRQLALDFASSPLFEYVRKVYQQLKFEYKYIQKENKRDEQGEKEEKELQLALALSLEKNEENPYNYQKKTKYSEYNPLTSKRDYSTAIISRVRALFDFHASEPGELSFQRGDIITVLEVTHKDWWYGSLNGKMGIFPNNYVEKLQEPTPDELRMEIENEIKVLSYEENIEKLLEILSNVGLTENNNIIESEKFQNLYHSTLTIRSNLIKLIKKYAQKKGFQAVFKIHCLNLVDDIISLNERFVKAMKDYEILMEKSMTHFSYTSLHNQSVQQYHDKKHDDFQKYPSHLNFPCQNEGISHSTESYYSVRRDNTY